MTHLGGLEEALEASLLEGPLQLDPVSVVERGADAEVGLPGPEEIPVVSIGVPRAWAVAAPPPVQGETIAGIGAIAPAIGPNERVLLLRMACSFRARSDQTEIIWARFTERLLGDDPHLLPPIALDLYPLAVNV